MLNQLSIDLLELVSRRSDIDLDEAALVLETNKKRLISEVDKINPVLLNQFDFEITIQKNKFSLPKDFKERWLMSRLDLSREDIFLVEDRTSVIIIYSFLNNDFISNYHLQDLLGLSKNSVLTEVRKVKEACIANNVSYEYNRSKGYHFIGEEFAIVSLVEDHLNQLLLTSIGEWVLEIILTNSDFSSEFLQYQSAFEMIIQDEEISIVPSRKKALIWLFYIISIRKRHQLVSWQTNFPESPLDSMVVVANQVASLFFKEYTAAELLFVSSRILGSLDGMHFTEIGGVSLESLTRTIIRDVSNLIGVTFPEGEEIYQSLLQHVGPAYIRIKYDIPLNFPFSDEITMQYGALFSQVKRALRSVFKKEGLVISDEEISLFTVHFGGYLNNHSIQYKPTRALVVCPNGISSSLILTSTLEKLFPKFEFKKVHQISEIKNLATDEFDLIFSTTVLEIEKPLYVVKPILDYVESQLLIREVSKDFESASNHLTYKLEDLISTIEKHAEIKDLEQLKMDLIGLLDNQKTTLKGGPTLSSLLKEEFIRFSHDELTWQEAIALASQPLIETGNIEESYIQAMIDSALKSGPYMVLAPGVAVPHARPETGVNKLGISLLSCTKAVDFSMDDEADDDNQVCLIFVLAAEDNTNHLTALQQLSMILEDDENIDLLKSCQSPVEIMNEINKIIEKGDN
ncbi:PTS transporter subunit EIIA [Vagococcus coleopterorum]|uniref:Ascorbate-specific PTS system EIIA component n=1 Tax=Vagococcus coleopterorum TaxID=2714946 RepID=A0A6G8APA6_9ENTE|nr:PTS sugar transporter subunit IIA [Vagococcus coleopterorum]QIL46810.1 PTS transporter subunit EIIA [Vagococcus coleopterorum]